jgi:hypothetical protein
MKRIVVLVDCWDERGWTSAWLLLFVDGRGSRLGGWLFFLFCINYVQLAKERE